MWYLPGTNRASVLFVPGGYHLVCTRWLVSDFAGSYREQESYGPERGLRPGWSREVRLRSTHEYLY